MACAAVLALAPAQAVTYTLTDLGKLNGLPTAARAINNLGQVVGDTSTSSSWIWSAGSGLQELPPWLPGSVGGSPAGINDAGHVVGVSYGTDRSSAFLWSGGTGAQPLPLDAVQSIANGINASGQIVGVRFARSAPATPQAFLYDSSGLTTTLTGSARDSAAAAINDRGQVVGWATDAALVQHAFLWTPGLGLQDLTPTATGSTKAEALNNRGQVVGMTLDASGNGRPFLWQPGGGLQVLGSVGRASLAVGINDSGQVVGWGVNDSSGTPMGAFIWSPRSGMVDVNSLLSATPASRVTYAAAINRKGQIVGQDTDLNAVLLTPTGELAWQGASGGDFSDGRNWELNFEPSSFVDAQIYTAGTQRITLATDTAVHSLGLGAAAGGRPTLSLQDGATLAATYGVTVRATGTLTGDGTVQGAVVNLGSVLGSSLRITGGLQNQGLVVAPAVSPGWLQTELLNQPGGQLRVESSQKLQLLGSAHRNEGSFEIRGGELALSGTLDNAAGARILMGQGGVLRLNPGLANSGQLNVGFGGAEIFGSVMNRSGGQIVLSGNSNTTFYDAVAVESGGELRVSAGSTALFFGLVRQGSGALFTGTGTKFYEGRLTVDTAPGLGVDEGSVVLGSGAEFDADIGGTAPGSGHDQLKVAGELHFGGTLKLQAWAGYAAQDGQRFDLFDWGRSSGRFDRIDASGLLLGNGLMLDVSRLYIDGSIGVTTVPEPASWALMLFGAGCVARRFRPVPAGNAAARC